MNGKFKSINGCRDKVNDEEERRVSEVEIYEANLWKLIKFSLNFSPVHFHSSQVIFILSLDDTSDDCS